MTVSSPQTWSMIEVWDSVIGSWVDYDRIEYESSHDAIEALYVHSATVDSDSARFRIVTTTERYVTI